MIATVPQKAREIRAQRGVALPGQVVSEIPPLRAEPDDVAPFVVYLATDAAAQINGQTFLVRGGVVSLLNYPAPTRTITKRGRWTPEEIAQLFPHTLGMDLVNPAPKQSS
jgi:hypothetical protein